MSRDHADTAALINAARAVVAGLDAMNDAAFLAGRDYVEYPGSKELGDIIDEIDREAFAAAMATMDEEPR